jgi:hypothetical protein
MNRKSQLASISHSLSFYVTLCLMMLSTAVPGCHPEVICDGGEITSLLNTATIQEKEDTRGFDNASDGSRHWLRVDVRTAD